MSLSLEALRAKLTSYQQQHLLAHWDKLDASRQQYLLQQIESIDWEEIRGLANESSKAIDWEDLSARAKPPQAIRLADADASAHAAKTAGEKGIREGKVAMILVAGGQGTRLGFDKPKGMFRIGPVSNRTLFAMHVDSLRGAMKKFGVEIPLFIMTSPATDQETRDYFKEHNHLGLPPHLLTIFQQGTMPAIDASSGRVLMDDIDRIAMSPDGHGGIVKALKKQGILAQCEKLGIEHFFYAQVDNPLITACDPVLVGHHLLAGSRMTTQVVQKRFATEKVGNVVSIDGRTQIIEYSDLPVAAAERKNSDGSLELWAGNIAVHVIERSFFQEASERPDALPFHRAVKAVPFMNSQGEQVKPDSPNAIKFERFVFDLLPLASTAIVVEGEAADVFAPVKNADGATTDTPAASKKALSDKAKRWLQSAHIECSENCSVEINPTWAWDAEDVRSKLQSSPRIQTNTYFA